MKKIFRLFAIAILLMVILYMFFPTLWKPYFYIGHQIDSFNGIAVFYNGKISNVDGRNLAADGYNLGLRYQCVEFVKRYYYEFYKHKMPNPYGHAKDFFNKKLSDGEFNGSKGLLQFSNGSKSKPCIGDILVLKGNISNPFGHVAIITEVSATDIEIIQQNAGVYGNSRARFPLIHDNNKWMLKNERILGWLRIKQYKNNAGPLEIRH